MAKKLWQIVKELADSSCYSQDPHELSATLQVIYRIAEIMAAGGKPGEGVGAIDERNGACD